MIRSNILRTVGMLLVMLGLSMSFSLGWSLYYSEGDHIPIIQYLIVTVVSGVLLIALCKDKNKVDELFNAVIYCIDYIYDEEKTYSTKDHTKKEMHDFVDSLTDTQFQKMTKFFETIPALKHNITLDCKNKLKNST